MSRIVKDYIGMVAIGLLLLVGFGAAAIFVERETSPEPVAAISPTRLVTGEPDLLVDAFWLAENKDSIDLIIDLSDIDVYENGHIPGAIHVWYEDTMLIDSPVYGEPGYLTLDGPRESRIVVYDNNASERASYFLWLLRTSGFQNSWLLDGGLGVWKGTGNPVSGQTEELNSDLVPAPGRNEANVIVTDELFVRFQEPGLTIIDSRTRHQQQDTINETIRVGKIPGSWSIPSSGLMREDGTFRSPDEMQALFAPLGLEPGSEIVVYGRFGIETGQMWLALELAGYQNNRIYDQGWVMWGWIPHVPIEPLDVQPAPVTPIASTVASPVASPVGTPMDASPVATPR